MAQTINLTAQDVCQVLQVERHALRRWLEGLPVYAEQPTRARSARRFDMADLIFLSAVLELETRYGLGLATIARFDADLLETVRGQGLGLQFLFLDIETASCSQLDAGLPARPGIVLDLGPAYQRVASAFRVPTPFPELPFGTVSQPLAAPTS